MRKAHLIMMFVLLTFVGQAFASVIMSANMPMSSMSSLTKSTLSTDNKNACHDMNMQKNAMNNMSDNESDNESDNCCAQTCHCPVGSCLSVGLTMALPTLKSEVSLVNSATMFTSALMPQYFSSLYRPPIFA
ncbi:CopL family metal-binding regulatory protein [Shewanella frigidimarina]|uniref:CopL family metal-binding regulatory protein n=1 Tax=Shewanella frigidimarina TaxID=56812 RepID=UPI003F9EE6E8